jgi:hypothetical protein
MRSRPRLTIGDDVEHYVNQMASASEEEFHFLTLTEVAALVRPTRLDALGYDEIAFIYPDGSRYVTGICNDAEWYEFLILRAHFKESAL